MPDSQRIRLIAREELSRTIPASAFATTPSAGIAPPHPTAAGARPSLPGTSVVGALRGDPSESRWRVGGELGAGATARVYAATDRNLRREVAVKLLAAEGDRQELERFLAEARIAASLEHPSVIPVHELGVDAAGRLFYAMKKVEGRSLARELEETGRGRLAAVNTLVSIFIDLCGAIAYAHHHGVVHQDLKPDNIMLGDFGEVLVVDWGSAAEVDAGGRVAEHIYGTPLYMSPEQARREYVDTRSDIFALGATMLHALTGRLPLWRDALETFWEAKRRGQIDAPTAAERRLVPAQLIAIAMKALAADPAARYQSVKAMREDLERFQAGFAVSALRESPFARLRRWYRANRALSWMSLAAALALGVIVLVVARDRALESSSWREIYREDFSRPTTQEELARQWTLTAKRDWLAPAAEIPIGEERWVTVRDGALQLCAQVTGDLSPRMPLLGDLRVEWTYRALDQNQNLNCFIGGPDREHAYVAHIGGWADPARCVLTRGALGPVLADRRDALCVEQGRAYRYAMEKDGQRIRLWIDGKPIFDHTDYGDAEGLTQRGFGFEAVNWCRVAIDDLVVYRKPLAQKVSPLVVGDDLLRAGSFEPAARRYEELAACYPGTDLAIVALLRQGQCTARLGDQAGAEADALLARFLSEAPGHELEPVALYERWVLARRRGDAAAAAELLQRLAVHHGHPILCSVLAELGKDRLAVLVPSSHNVARPGMNRFPDGIGILARDGLRSLQQQSRAFGLGVGNPDLEGKTAGTLKMMGHPEWMLELLPLNDEHYGESLLEMGRYDEIFARFQHVPWLVAEASFANGRYDAVLQHRRDWSWLSKWAQLESGDIDGALANMPEWDRGRVLVRTGRFEEAVSQLKERDGWRLDALCRLGRYAEVIASPDDTWAARARAEDGDFDGAVARCPLSPSVMYETALLRRIAGQRRESDELLAALAGNQDAIASEELMFAHHLMAPVLSVLEGRAPAIAPLLRQVLSERRWTMAQRVWHDAALICGEIDDRAYLAQPHRRFLAARLAFAGALREDCAGRRAAALDGYRRYLAMQLYQRPDDRCRDTFAEWRARVLGGEAPAP